jgi:hypothetical protein
MNYGRSYHSRRSSEKLVQNRCRPKLNGISPLKLVITSLAGPERNEGATFTVRLPVRIVHQEAAEHPADAESTVSSAKWAVRAVKLKNLRTLAADDDDGALELIPFILQGAEFTPETLMQLWPSLPGGLKEYEIRFTDRRLPIERRCSSAD